MFYIVHLDLNLKQVVRALQFKCRLVVPCKFDTFRKHVVTTSCHVHEPTYPGQHATQNKNSLASALTFGHTDKFLRSL